MEGLSRRTKVLAVLVLGGVLVVCLGPVVTWVVGMAMEGEEAWKGLGVMLLFVGAVVGGAVLMEAWIGPATAGEKRAWRDFVKRVLG